MTENTLHQACAPARASCACGPSAMATAPMGKLCARMMDKPRSGALLALPGVLLIVLGVFAVLEPAVVVWLVGTVCVLLGLMFLAMALFLRRMAPHAAGMSRPTT